MVFLCSWVSGNYDLKQAVIRIRLYNINVGLSSDLMLCLGDAPVHKCPQIFTPEVYCNCCTADWGLRKGQFCTEFWDYWSIHLNPSSWSYLEPRWFPSIILTCWKADMMTEAKTMTYLGLGRLPSPALADHIGRTGLSKSGKYIQISRNSSP